MKEHEKMKKFTKRDPLDTTESILKESIFYFIHILLKLPDNGLWIDIIIIIIEMIQFLAFPFSLMVFALFINPSNNSLVQYGNNSELINKSVISFSISKQFHFY